MKSSASSITLGLLVAGWPFFSNGLVTPLSKYHLAGQSSWTTTTKPSVHRYGRPSRLFLSDENNQHEDDTFFPEVSQSTDPNSSTTISSKPTKKKASKRAMLSFAIPALGIYLANPLLSNIDNSFVGKTVGTKGLAALSPATICTDQMIYLFSFLSRATTGLVSRAYGGAMAKSASNLEDGKTKEEAAADAAAEAGSAPLTVALLAGVMLSIVYAFGTPKMLELLNVTPELRKSASSYIYWRGSIAWAALAQGVSLSVMMATRDAITPLKIIGLAAIVNIIGDYMLCVWPLRFGCSGAAAATAFATLFSSGFMVRALKKKGILPKIRLPTRKEIAGLTEFTGPLFAITITRLIGFVNMQRTAMSLGVKHTAAYQLSINLVLFFLLFAEPLSQLSQTQLPSLIDAKDGPSVKANLKSVLILGVLTSLLIGGTAGLTLFFGSSLFSSDLAVQALAKQASGSVFLTVATAIFAVTVDGAMLASRDFGFMLTQGVMTMLMQIFLLKTWCTNIMDIYMTFTLRLGSYALLSLLRAGLGFGKLGRALRDDNVVNGAAINGSYSPNGASPKAIEPQP